MTLLLTFASRDGIFLSSDHRLTGGRFAEFLGSKQISFRSVPPGVVGRLCFTGFAEVKGDGRTVDWISRLILEAAQPIDVGVLANNIAIQGAIRANRINPPAGRMLTVLIGVTNNGELRLMMVSNFYRLDGPPANQLLPNFIISSLLPERPLFRSYGADVAVEGNHRFLRRALRSGSQPKTIMSALANLNARAAQEKASQGRISVGCIVSYLRSDGSASDFNYGATLGVPNIVIGGLNVSDWLNKHFKSGPGGIGMRQGASGPILKK